MLPAPPPVPDFHFRTYRGEEDLPALVELLRAADEANGEEMVASVDRLRNNYSNMTRIDPRKDIVLGFVGTRLVAHSLIEWADTAYGERHFNSLGNIHPAWRRRGIGTAMAQRNEQRLIELAVGQSFDETAVLTTWMQDLDAGGLALARQRGYQRVRIYHHMVRPSMDDITVPALPDGLELRPLTRDLVRDYWDAMCEAFRDHFGSWDASEPAFRSWVDGPLFDLDLQIVAFDGDHIAGGIHGAIDPTENNEHGYLRGWAEPIFTRRPWRRRGLATALLGRTLAALRDRGMTSAQLHVDSENTNDAAALYERHGFAVRSSSSEWHRTLQIDRG
jgi:GNAT superfamily N-acetyltransferase